MSDEILIGAVTLGIIFFVMLSVTTNIHSITTEPCTLDAYGCIDAFEEGADWKYKMEFWNDTAPNVMTSTSYGAVVGVIAILAVFAIWMGSR